MYLREWSYMPPWLFLTQTILGNNLVEHRLSFADVATAATRANVKAIPTKRGKPLRRKGWSARAKPKGPTGKMHGLMIVSMPPTDANRYKSIRFTHVREISGPLSGVNCRSACSVSLSRRPYTTLYTAGTRKTVTITEAKRPPMIARASGAYCSLPASKPRANGIMPSTVAREVIRIGRKRLLHDCTTAFV